MADPVGSFDRTLLPEGWFSETTSPSGWFDGTLLASVGGEPSGVAAAIAITELADTLSGSLTVALSASGNVSEAPDIGLSVTAAAVSASSILNETVDSVSAVSQVYLAAQGSIGESGDALASSVSVGLTGVAATVSAVESPDLSVSTTSVSAQSSILVSKSEDSIQGSVSVGSGVTSDINLQESSDLLASGASVINALISDGKSGYWRQFIYQLQEESLKKHEQKQRKSSKTSSGSRAASEPLESSQPLKRRVKLEPLVELEIYEPVPKSKYWVQESQAVPKTACLIQQNLLKLLNLKAPLEAPLPVEPAVNDEEEVVELLLLTA